jgi:hypothetical protein
MVQTTGWVIYERRDGEFIFLSKPLKTRKQAEEKRTKLKTIPEHKRAAIGIGFVRVS